MGQQQVKANIETFKDAANRMGKYFSEQGFHIPRQILLEGMSKAIGDKNYRTFRAALERAPAKESVALPVGPRWEVTMFYNDNQQEYTSDYEGVDALQAAVVAQLERQADEFGSDVTVVKVVDRLSGLIADTGDVGDTDIRPHGEALRRCVDTAKDLLKVDSLLEANGPEGHRLAAAILVLDEYLGEPNLQGGARKPGVGESLLNEFSRHFEGTAEPGTIQLSGCGLVFGIDPTQAIELVAQYILGTVQIEGWARVSSDDLRDAYHAQALVRYYAPQLHYSMSGDGYDVELAAQKVELTPAQNTRAVTWSDILLERLTGQHSTRNLCCDAQEQSYFYII